MPSAGLELAEVVPVIRGLEMTGLVELKTATAQTLIVVLEEDSRTLALIQGVLGPEGDGFPLRHVRDRVAVQLLLRRHPSAVVLMALDSVEQEGLFQALRDHAAADHAVHRHPPDRR